MTVASVTSNRHWRTGGLALLSAGGNLAFIAALVLSRSEPHFQRRPVQSPLYLDIEPRPALPRERSSSPVTPPGAVSGRLDRDRPTPFPLAAEPVPAAAEPTQSDVDPRWRVAPGTVAPASLPLSCDAPLRLTLENRRRCDLRWSGRGETVDALTGSGDAERDARFARQGTRRLAAWEAQRAEPPQGDPPCENPNPVAGCAGVNIQVELFSSRDGLLPNLRKRRE